MREWEPELLDNLIHTVRSGQCIVFCGCGISRPCGFPSLNKLLCELAKPALSHSAFDEKSKGFIKALIDDKPKNNNLITYMDQIKQHCPGEFLLEFRKMFPINVDHEFSEVHNIILQIGFCGVLTTNYDMCFESAARSSSSSLRVCGQLEEFTGTKECPKIYHLHGTCNQPDGCIITPTQFYNLYTQDFQGRLDQLLSDYTVLYVGSALSEYELFRIMSRRSSIYIDKNRFPDARDHFALVPLFSDTPESLDRERLFNQYKIRVQFYEVDAMKDDDTYGDKPEHHELLQLLRELKSKLGPEVLTKIQTDPPTKVL